MKKRIMCLVLWVLVFASMLAFDAFAKVYGGTSDGITWSIELNNGEMEISGNGAVPDSLNHTSTPWGNLITLAKRITVKEGITSIGDNAFMYARQAHTVILPETLVNIGQNAFAYCHELENINLPDSLESIGKNAFASCKSLSQIEFPASLGELGAYAFSSCVSLGAADLSDTKITHIGEGTFASCCSLRSVKLPETVLSVGDAAFFNCVKVDTNGAALSGLESVRLPSGVTYVGQKAFYNCLKLSDLSFTSYPEVFADTFYNVPATYTVTFKNRDESVIFSYDAPVNSVAAYNGAKPTAESTTQYDFSFKSWDRPFEAVLGDTEYTAVYKETLRKYNITWIVDGEVVDVRSETYGTTPKYWASYPDKVPQKEGHIFATWDPLVESVNGDAAYTAVFVKKGLGDFDDNGKTDEEDVNTLASFLLGTISLTDEQIMRANVYTADDKPGSVPEENINIKDLIFVAQMASSSR